MRLVAIAIAEITSIMTLLLLSGHGPWAGRVVIRLGGGHGLNVGDFPVLVLWAGALTCCIWLWRQAEP